MAKEKQLEVNVDELNKLLNELIEQYKCENMTEVINKENQKRKNEKQKN